MGSRFVATDDLAMRIRAGNCEFDTGNEYRTQNIYGDELWAKLSRGGLSKESFKGKRVLELCAGNGFLTYHFLRYAKPLSLVVNDISETELESNQRLISTLESNVEVKWLRSDMHELELESGFDVVIGNSFLHHFYDVPKALKKIHSLLRDGGVFVSLHEPTPVATFVESGRAHLAPLAAMAPQWMNDLVRVRYTGGPSPTDLWLFKPSDLASLGKKAGFQAVRTEPFGLFRPWFVGRYQLHLCEEKPLLNDSEAHQLHKAIRLDNLASRILPASMFGSVTTFFYR